VFFSFLIIKNKHLIYYWFIFSFFTFLYSPKNISAASSLIINEIMYDLPGSDDKHEWIELFNNGTETIDLSNWKFNDGSNHKLNPPSSSNGGRGSLLLAPGEYLLLADDAQTLINDLPNYQGTIIDTVMNLNNTTDTIKIINAEGETVASATYNKELGAAGNGKTLSWDGSSFRESLSEGGTPGKANDFIESFSPLISSSPSSSPSPSPSSNNSFSSPPITSDNFSGLSSSPSEEDKALNNPSFDYSEKILLSEFLPYPENDKSEWIELYNNGDSTVNLTGWSLADANNHSLKIPDQSKIYPRQYLVISLSRSFLNNDGDQIKLIWPDGQIIHSVTYQKAKQNFACARLDNQWVWTNQPTPGQANKNSLISLSPVKNSSSNSVSPTNFVVSPREESVISQTGSEEKQTDQKASFKESSEKLPQEIAQETEGEPQSSSSVNISASAQDSLKNINLKSTTALIGVLTLAGLTAGGLIYLKHQKQVDNQDLDE